MARTVRRQPFSVSTDNNNYSKPYLMTQAQFKGLCDNQNNVDVDQQTFTSVNNVYVDESGVLTSRPPFKFANNFADTEKWIIDQWLFGTYGLRLYRYLCKYEGNRYIRVDKDVDDDDTLYFVYTVRCLTHQMFIDTESGKYGEYSWIVNADLLNMDTVPKVTCAQIEDKIFIWFAGIDFIALNTRGILVDGINKLYFESAVKYLYYPIHKQIINGIESDLETKNFLTDTYRRRYIYSALSSVNFETLSGREMSVGMNGPATNISKHLYDITVRKNQDRMLVYPHSAIGGNYHIDIVETPRATVILQYSRATHIIKISFDGKIFSPVSTPDGIIDVPQLTRDGLGLVAFTRTGLAKCLLTTQDSIGTEPLNWTIQSYMRKAINNGSSVMTDKIDETFIPRGYFETLEQFAYVIRAASVITNVDGNIPYLYSEWPNGDNGIIWGFEPLIEINADSSDPIIMTIQDDDIKVHFCYVAPTVKHPELGAIVSILAKNIKTYVQNSSRTIDRVVRITVFELEDGPDNPTGYNNLIRTINDTIQSYNIDDFNGPCTQQDVRVSISNISTDADNEETITYEFMISCGLIGNDGTNIQTFDYLKKYRFTTSPLNWKLDTTVSHVDFGNSKWFRIMQNGDAILTDKYLYIDNEFLSLPQDGELSLDITDKERTIINNDCLLFDRLKANIHKIVNTAESGAAVYALTSGIINSGDLVSYTSDAITEQDYIPDTETGIGNFFYIKHISEDDLNTVIAGEIRVGDFIVLESLNKDYPAAPDWTNGDPWTSGDPWPFDFPAPYGWKVGNALPSLKIKLYGTISLEKRVQPICIINVGVWYIIDGTLWTSHLDTDIPLELDEFVNVTRDDDTIIPSLNAEVPDHHAVMREHYFSFNNLLEVTQVKRDEDKLFNDDGTDLLLYMPKRNEQKFANKITALHPLSDTEIGIFTEKDIWYIQAATLNDGSSAYTMPVRSKLPVGLRDGDEVVTALDGQALIFPTMRGIVALAPQDFVATTEKTLTYLSDSIQAKYNKFYNDNILNFASMHDESDTYYNPQIDSYNSQIHITTYKYWLMFYKYFDREILAFDTRTTSWWIWTAPYPIRSIMIDNRMKVLMQIDFSPIQDFELTLPARKAPLMGVSFVWADKENIDEIGYTDTIIDGALNGLSTLVYENEIIGNRRVLQYASPIINWHFTSQRLHFGQINNYKAVKGLVLNLNGDEMFGLKLSTKAFRSLYHPETKEVMEIMMNEAGTFVKPLNLLHLINFQYKLENDTPHQLKLNSIGIKYEVKERIR